MHGAAIGAANKSARGESVSSVAGATTIPAQEPKERDRLTCGALCQRGTILKIQRMTKRYCIKDYLLAGERERGAELSLKNSSCGSLFVLQAAPISGRIDVLIPLSEVTDLICLPGVL